MWINFTNCKISTYFGVLGAIRSGHIFVFWGAFEDALVVVRWLFSNKFLAISWLFRVFFMVIWWLFHSISAANKWLFTAFGCSLNDFSVALL